MKTADWEVVDEASAPVAEGYSEALVEYIVVRAAEDMGGTVG